MVNPSPCDAFLDKLICPRSKTRLIRRGQELLAADGSASYSIVNDVPDLRVTPDRLVIDAPWYEPWQDLDSVVVGVPDGPKVSEVPPRLDRHQAAAILSGESERWILEVGCGENWSKPWLTARGYEFVGVDVESRGPGPDLLADAHNLPIASQSIDLAISFAALEHVVSPITVVSEIQRVLKQGGRFVGSSAFMYGFHDKASFFHMSHAGLLCVLRVAGFEVVRMWSDWPYWKSVSQWGFRGTVEAPWRWVTGGVLWGAEHSFVTVSNCARRVVGKPIIDRALRDVQMAGSVSFIARKPA